MKIISETADLYRLTEAAMFNCFLVKEGRALTLIDTNLPGSSEAILGAANSLGLPITRIGSTHAHFDHVGSFDMLAKSVPEAEIGMGRREVRFLRGDFSRPGREWETVGGIQAG